MSEEEKKVHESPSLTDASAWEATEVMPRTVGVLLALLMTLTVYRLSTHWVSCGLGELYA